ncbi:MAG: lytic transglycosylase domain-containing protein [Parvibaculum sp.]
MARLALKTVLAISLALSLTFSAAGRSEAQTAPLPQASPRDRGGRHSESANIISKSLSQADLKGLVDALAEADRKNWPEAMRHTARITDEAAAKFVLWYRLVTKDSGATLAEIVAFKGQNPNWPRMSLLSLRAEEALLSYPMSNADIINWFNNNPPQTGEGRIRYGKALMASSKAVEGKNWIRLAWAENDFTRTRQQEILANYGNLIDAAANRARLDRLLWDRRTSDARATAALIGENAKALADARIHLMSRSRNAPDAVARVQGALRNDNGLLFDRIRYERKTGNDDATVPLILTAPAQTHQMVDPDAWWIERKIAARVALANSQYKEAYAIVSKHGLKSGSDFADAEFLSGWVALQYLNNPGQALTHFLNLKNAVSTPISTARADYWAGRAASAKGDKKTAELYYRLASNNPTTFYGQLGAGALAHLTGTVAHLRLPSDPKPTKAQIAAFKKLELIHVAHILHDLHRDDQAWSFMLHLADTLKEPQQLVQLSDLAISFDDRKLSLRIAKTASQRNIILPQRAYPVSSMPRFTPKGPSVEKALIFGLSRQESEFDPAAKSPVGARGLMQLMPTTAKVVARQIDVPYSHNRLTSDPAYNAMLGTAHLGDLIEGFDGSYIMSVAAYNAGKSRVDRWEDDYGDPRSPTVDPIDWIESIPFSETRNYVQRVMENLEIYRTRLSGQAQKVRISDDIRRSSTIPPAKPVPAELTTPAPAAMEVTPSPNAVAGTPLSPKKRDFAKP